jgi:hypothetical protein
LSSEAAGVIGSSLGMASTRSAKLDTLAGAHKVASGAGGRRGTCATGRGPARGFVSVPVQLWG